MIFLCRNAPKTCFLVYYARLIHPTVFLRFTLQTVSNCSNPEAQNQLHSKRERARAA